MADTICTEFIAYVQARVDDWIKNKKDESSTYIQLTLVQFFHNDDEFIMIFNTYGWQGHMVDEEEYETYKTGWWTTCKIKSDGSDLQNKQYGLDKVLADAYLKYMNQLQGLSWNDKDAVLYAK